jgi:chemotaxis protein methyltransferase CheR
MEQKTYPADFYELKKGIKELLNFNTGQYKDTYLGRRFNARMRAFNLDSYHDYWKLLKDSIEEQQRLRDDLTINVTEFFRDNSAYQELLDHILPILATEKDKIRIWSAGSSDGKEAYSLAILMTKLLGEQNAQQRVSIIGSDIDRVSLDNARNAVYQSRPGVAQTDIQKQLQFLQNPTKYFDIEDDLYSIKPSIKQLVRFENYDLISGPKKRNYDLILCRNVVIYFNKELQEILYKDFFNALNPGGFFVMGKTETLIGEARDLFTPYNTKERIFRKR